MKSLTSFFRDKNGKVVIIQFPNWILWTVIVIYGVQFLGNPTLSLCSFWLSRIFLVYWSYLEIRSGVDGFRKVLGFTTLLYILYSIVHL